MRFSSKKKKKEVNALHYFFLSGLFVSVATHLQILEVTLTPTLGFSLYISNIVAKVRRTLGFIARV